MSALRATAVIEMLNYSFDMDFLAIIAGHDEGPGNSKDFSELLRKLFAIK